MSSIAFEIYSAGILPYTKYNNKIYFLLGRDFENKWSDFGGRCESKDKGDYETTACREFTEETLGSVYNFNYVKKIVKMNNKRVTLINSKTPSGHDYYMYLLKINYDESIRSRFYSTRNFLTSMYELDKKNIDKKYIEKTDIRWLSMETILYSIDEDKNLIDLRNVFSQTFKNNYGKIMGATKFSN